MSFPSGDILEAARFIDLIGGSELFTLDNAKVPNGEGKLVARDNTDLARRFPSLLGNIPEIESLQAQGAGVYLVGNELPLGARRVNPNISRVRGVFADIDDGVARAWPLQPSLIVRTSEAKWQCWWLCDELSEVDFEALVHSIVSTFQTDKNVTSIGNLLRCPGFYNMKAEPHLVDYSGAGQKYTREDLLGAFPPLPRNAEARARSATPVDMKIVRSALDYVSPCPRDNWIKVGSALKREYGDDGREVWDEWSAESDKFDEDKQDATWYTLDKRETGKIADARAIINMAKEKGWSRGAAALDVVLSSECNDIIVQEAVSEIAERCDEVNWPYVVPAAGKTFKTDNGHPGNADHLLDFLNVRLRFNTLAGVAEFDGGCGFKEVDDNVVNQLHTIAARLGYRPRYQDFVRLVRAKAYKTKHHPVVEYLKGLPKWDGVERVDHWASLYLGAADDLLTREIGRVALIGAVQRALQPGCKFDYMIVLEGEQGTQKSTALRVLGGPWFTDQVKLGSDAKIMIEQTGNVWIAEVPELSGMAKREVEAIKSQITAQEDRSRLAFGQFTTKVPRAFVMAGTTNSERYLRDATGNRRFLPIKTGRIDIAALKANRDQLWAEAYARVLAGEQSVLAEGLWDAARAAQEARLVVNDHLLERLRELFDAWTGQIEKSAVYRALGMEEAKMRPGEAGEVTKAMRQLGWKTVDQVRREGKRPNCYVKPAADGAKPWLSVVSGAVVAVDACGNLVTQSALAQCPGVEAMFH